MAVSFRVFNRNIVTFYTHIIMSVTAGKLRKIDSAMDFVVEPISEVNLNDCANSEFNIDIMRRYLKKQSDKAKGYLFKDKNTGDPIGYLWVMKKGGNEIQYRIRNTDAFLFDVFVFEKYRGKRFVNTMLAYIAENELSKNDILRLAVRKNNEPAIKAYRRSGFKDDCNKSFIRILKVNFPYHKV